MNRMFTALRTPFAARGAAAFMGLSLATGVIVGLAAAGLTGAIVVLPLMVIGAVRLARWSAPSAGS